MILQLQGCGKVGRCRNKCWVCSRPRRVQALFLFSFPLFFTFLLDFRFPFSPELFLLFLPRADKILFPKLTPIFHDAYDSVISA